MLGRALGQLREFLKPSAAEPILTPCFIFAARHKGSIKIGLP